jgi:hypothetical protein
MQSPHEGSYSSEMNPPRVLRASQSCEMFRVKIEASTASHDLNQHGVAGCRPCDAQLRHILVYLGMSPLCESILMQGEPHGMKTCSLSGSCSAITTSGPTRGKSSRRSVCPPVRLYIVEFRRAGSGTRKPAVGGASSLERGRQIEHRQFSDQARGACRAFSKQA